MKNTHQDWIEMRKESEKIFRALAALTERDPAEEEVQKAIARWHQLIDNRFYKCNLEMFRQLANLYVSDNRSSANIDKYKPGLAKFMRDAMHLYCDKQEK
ncbi:MAG: hypothetical protein FH749_09700 [Firmicutes bacterium]|nr:hypothetical protein [Bacillota bacterium]